MAVLYSGMDLPESITCPACDEKAVLHDVGGLAMEICTGCGGLWFGSNQLKRILATGPEALDEMMRFEPDGPHSLPKHSTLMCPLCGISLHRNLLVGTQGVTIHTCYGCAGLFLESEQLTELDRQAHLVNQRNGIGPLSTEARAAVDQLERMTAEDRRRTECVYDILLQRTSPYWQRRGWGRWPF